MRLPAWPYAARIFLPFGSRTIECELDIGIPVQNQSMDPTFVLAAES